MTKTPNFFIVGAPKCGTTALYDYLKQHPDVFMPEDVKEPHFFGSDIRSPGYYNDLAEYIQLFEPVRNQKRIGESSVWYLYSKKAAQEIYEFCPQARIIIMLRNPVDVMYSYHSQRLYNRTEDLTDFADALMAELDRKKGLRLPEHPYPIHGMFYREIVKFSEQVQRYLDVFPRAQVKIIIYDDFKKDTAGVYREVLEFLGVDPNFQAVIRPINANKTYRSAWVRDWMRRSVRSEQHVARVLLPKPLRHGLLLWLNNLNRKEKPRTPLDPGFRRTLEQEFTDEIHNLEAILRYNLRHWYAQA